MLLKTQGIVLKKRNIGENDKILTILSKDLGIIEASARGAKRMKSPLQSASQELCYAEFCLYQGKNRYSVNSATPIALFYDLRLDVVKLSMAVYFCDLMAFLFPFTEGEILEKNLGHRAWEYLRFLLNTLSFLEKGKRDPELLKSIYELRLLSLSGFMPDLVCCQCCQAYEKEEMYFFPYEAQLVCGDCLKDSGENSLDGTEQVKFSVPSAVLHAMRHIIYSDEDRVFSFNLSGKALEQLNFITENYTLIHTDTRFKSLEFYNQMKLAELPSVEQS